MSRTAHKLMASSGGGAYEIEQSLMFDQGANAHLMKNYSNAGTRTKWTFSAWVKRSHVQTGHADSGKGNIIFSAWDNSTQTDNAYFALNWYADKIWLGGFNTNWRVTNRLFRDPATWFHILLAVDTTQSTADNRIKLYIDGVQETSFSQKNNPSQNSNTAIGAQNYHMVGAVNASGTISYYKGYIAEAHYIDGMVRTPSSFGETDSATGQWIPKEYTETYGSNGAYLKFVSGALGTDSSGQGNTWTASNLANSDVMLDSPTNNFPILNMLDNGTNSTLTQGSLKATFSGWSDTFGTFQVPFTGKWYVEHAVTTKGNTYFGLWTTNYTDTDAGQDYGTSKLIVYHGGVTGGLSGGYMSAWSDGDIIGMAIDCDNGKLHWSKNGTYGSSGNPATGANPALTFTAADNYKILVAGASGNVSDINFGQNGTFSGTKTAQGNADGDGIGNFYYAPPSGFKALCTKNLPNPSIKKSSEHFNAVVYTGTGSTRSVTGVGHKPGMLWIKAYSTTDDHRVQDEVRGSTKQLDINNNDAEYTASDGITSFDSDGFTIGADSSNQFNVSGTSSVAYSWKGAGSGSANNSGDIDATVSANPTAGVSIIKWTADGSNANTIAHGLGKKPSVVWYKKIDPGNAWYVLTDVIDGSQDYLAMSTAGAPISSAGSYGWATSSTISNWTWNSGHGMIAYAFAEIEGFSQFGTYNSNAVVNGPFIHTGFTPKFFLAKHTGGGSEWWYQYDTARDASNSIPAMLFSNANSAEYTSGSNVIDIVSNGVKLRANNGTINGYTSGNTYFYMAFAESPFKYANAR